MKKMKRSMMKIHLQPISGGTTCTVEVPDHATLADLRAEVCTAKSCEASSFALLLNGDELKSCRDKAALSECCVIDSTTLTFVRKVAPKALTASHDKTAKIWDCFTGECKQTLSGHTGWLKSAVFSEDGLTILTAADCSYDPTAKIWDCSTGECKQTLSGHTGHVNTAVKFLARLFAH